MSIFYSAVLGNGQQDILTVKTKPIELFSTTTQAVEVYKTPFEAIRALHRAKKIKPEYIVTIYETHVHDDHVIYINKNHDIHVLVMVDLVFTKVQEMALGSAVYFL